MDLSFTSEDTTSPSLKRPAEDSEASDASPAEKRVRFDDETIEVLRSAPTWDQLLEERAPTHSIAGLDDLECLGVDGNIATLRGTYLGETRSFKWEFKPSTLPPRFRPKDAHRRARVKQTARKHTVLDKYDRQHLTAVVTYLDNLKKGQRAIVNRGNKEAIAIWRTSGVPLDQLRAALDAHQEFERVLLQLEVERAINNKAQADLKARDAEIQILRAENHDLMTENRELEEQLRR